jgi:ParB family chromosome partitioning protein
MSSLPADLTARGQAKDGRRRRFTVDSLFVDHRPQAVGVTDLPTAKEIRLDRIKADPKQPRRSFDDAKLEELAASIRREGVLQPIAVRYDSEQDAYIVVHGERRLRAARMAGQETIPAIVRDVPEERRLIQQLMENIVRDDLNAVDRAAALRVLKTQLDDAPWEQVAEAVGIRRSRLFQLLGTGKLPEAAREDIRMGRLSEKQSRALQGLSPETQEAMRVAIVEDGIPAEEAMRLARELRAREPLANVDAAILQLRELRKADHTFRSEASSLDTELGALLSTLAAAASGGRAERAELARLADQIAAPAYNAERLEADVLALVRSLTRVPESALAPGGSAYAPLAAFAGALEAMLSGSGSR